MRVSVLIPVYNCSEYIRDAIESALAQNYDDFEIVVVDDGSEDETASMVKCYERVNYIYQSHSGISVARNRAIKEAKGDYICFLDADDRMHPDKLRKQVAYLDAHPECELVFCRYQSFSEISDSEMTMRQRQIGMSVYPCLVTSLIRIGLFQQWGGFSTHMNYGEDTQWMVKLLAGGVDFNHYLEEILYMRRVHSGNISLRHQQIGEKGFFSLLSDSIHHAKKNRVKHIEIN